MTGGGRRRPAYLSLAYGVPPAPGGTLHALTLAGSITMGPGEGKVVVFGRNRPDVHLCVGEDDRRVSRAHGTLSYRDGRWWVRNTGRQPIRLPGSRKLFGGEEPVPIADGYTPLFVHGSRGRQHLVEVYVTGPEADLPAPRHGDPTQPPRTWRLSPAERLALVVLGQRYLLHERGPQPLTWRQVSDELVELQEEAGWTPKRVEHLVVAVRNRLSRRGVPGLTREEVGEPVGNTLNHNLLLELTESTTLVPPDLALLDPASEIAAGTGSGPVPG